LANWQLGAGEVDGYFRGDDQWRYSWKDGSVSIVYVQYEHENEAVLLLLFVTTDVSSNGCHCAIDITEHS
jgi:hypothetical protein